MPSFKESVVQFDLHQQDELRRVYTESPLVPIGKPMNQNLNSCKHNMKYPKPYDKVEVHAQSKFDPGLSTH